MEHIQQLLQFYLHFSLGGFWLSVITRKKHMKATFFAIYNRAVYFPHSFCISSFSMLLRDMLYIFFLFLLLSPSYFLSLWDSHGSHLVLEGRHNADEEWISELRLTGDALVQWKITYFLGYYILKIPRLCWLCPLSKTTLFSVTIFLLKGQFWKIKCNVAIF